MIGFFIILLGSPISGSVRQKVASNKFFFASMINLDGDYEARENMSSLRWFCTSGYAESKIALYMVISHFHSMKAEMQSMAITILHSIMSVRENDVLVETQDSYVRVHSSSAKLNGSAASGSVLARMFSDYDQVVRPGYGGDATEILADLYVESFGNIQEVNMEFKVFGYLRQQWKDKRLSGKLNKTLTIKGETISRIWLPDPFCYNARDSNLMQPDSEVHSKVSIDVQGNVHYTKGVTFLASCEMDLRHFPFDSQECFLKIGSYAYSTEDIIYKWKYQEVEVEAKSTAQFDYRRGSLSSSFNMYKTGNFSTITVTYYFKRRMGYYLIQVYFPDICVVALSWIVFWMDKNDMGNRMALGITTILTIMFLLGSLNGTMPRVSYPKALDWYLLVSFSFAFLSLVECMIVFVVWLSSNKRKAKKENKGSPISKSPSTVKVTFHGGQHDSQIDDKANHVCLSNIEGVVKENISFLGHEKPPKSCDAADLIDKISRALFPIVFFIFNIGYWCYYLLAD